MLHHQNLETVWRGSRLPAANHRLSVNPSGSLCSGPCQGYLLFLWRVPSSVISQRGQQRRLRQLKRTGLPVPSPSPDGFLPSPVHSGHCWGWGFPLRVNGVRAFPYCLNLPKCTYQSSFLFHTSLMLTCNLVLKPPRKQNGFPFSMLCWKRN